MSEQLINLFRQSLNMYVIYTDYVPGNVIVTGMRKKNLHPSLLKEVTVQEGVRILTQQLQNDH